LFARRGQKSYNLKGDGFLTYLRLHLAAFRS